MNKTIKNILLFAGLFIILSLTLSCAGGPNINWGPVTRVTRDINDILDLDWMLEEVRFYSTPIPARVNRHNMMRYEVYTLRFDAERISGTGNANRFFAPYETNQYGDLSIGLIASTQMATLSEPFGINEREYFIYLGNADFWSIRDEKLQLFSYDADGNQVTLIFFQVFL